MLVSPSPLHKPAGLHFEGKSVLQLSSLAELSTLSVAVEGRPADFAERAE